MDRTVITKAKTVEEAILFALNELQVERSQVDVEVLVEPKSKGMLLKKETLAEVRVTVKEPQEQKPNNPSQLWIEKGELHMSSGDEGSINPRIIFRDPIKVKYKGVEQTSNVEINEGIESLEIYLPEAVAPEHSYDVYVEQDMLSAKVNLIKKDGVLFTLQDHLPATVVQLQVKQTKLPAPSFSVSQVIAAANKHELKITTTTGAIKEQIVQDRKIIEIIVAKGKPAVPPIDGSIEYFFRQPESSLDLDCDRIDYFELKTFPSVNAGDMIAKVVPGVPGIKGVDVYGNHIPVPAPKQAQLKVGEGVELSGDHNIAYANVPGMPSINNGVLKVLQKYELSGNADISTGNIRFNGEVIIRGDVCEQVQIEAFGGGIQVYGLVDHATLKSGGDIIITKNAIGSNLSAGGLQATLIKMLSLYNDLLRQMRQLLQAFEFVANQQSELEHGRLIKNLLELKFRNIPQMISDLGAAIEKEEDQETFYEPGLVSLIKDLEETLVGRGPLRIKSIDQVQQLTELLEVWIHRLQSSIDQPSDVNVRYIQNTKVLASGIVRVTGQGAYYSTIISGKGYLQNRGVFRGGTISVDNGNIELREIGSQSGIGTAASITKGGKMTIGTVYPNVSVSIGNQRYHFANQATNVRIFTGKDGLNVFAGSNKLSP